MTPRVRRDANGGYTISLYFLGKPWVLMTGSETGNWYVQRLNETHRVPLVHQFRETVMSRHNSTPVKAIEQLKYQLLRHKYQFPTCTFN